MSITPNFVPREYKTINILLNVKDAHKALEFYNRAFGAEVISKFTDSNNVVIYAEFKIEDTVIMISEAPDSTPPSGVILQIYCGDAQAFFETAIKAGAQEVYPIKEQFYGDRAGRIKDPFGHQWIISTHIEDVPAKDMQKRFNELYS